jgi:hypothetical protein
MGVIVTGGGGATGVGIAHPRKSLELIDSVKPKKKSSAMVPIPAGASVAVSR